MKLILLTFSSSKEEWFQQAKEVYTNKLQHFVSFEVEALKTSKMDRSQKDQKKRWESEQLMRFIKPDDLVVLLDEKGKPLDSEKFAWWLEREGLNKSYKRILFVVGGAFGVGSDVKARAQLTLQMGPWTLNHLVAQTVLMEQLYRAFTIIKGLPYHNQ